MNRLRKTAILFLAIEVLLMIWSILYASTQYNEMSTREYKVEVSRIKSMIESGTKLELIDLSKYKKVVAINEFNPEEKCKNEYAVEQINGKLYRFEYERASINKILFFIIISYIIIIVINIILFMYLSKKIVGPFMRMSGIACELAKGNLTIPIKQERSKYFKDFLWGLDMLRDKLETNKQRELKLLKERKLLVLSLSHDIKTPLSASDLYVKALLKNLYKTDEEKITALKGIEKNLLEIKGYVNEIADVSRDDFLTFEVNNSEFYLKELLLELNEYYVDKCNHLAIDFKIEKIDNCLLYGDYNRALEAIQNIIENAIKYGDGKYIKITFLEEEGCKLINVSNSGGIKQEEIPHLFDSFYRGTNAENVEGSGLGLYICKELMNKMDGEVFIKSTDMSFTVTLVFRKV